MQLEKVADQPSPDNQLILDFVKYTNQPIFLTGKAGTGKTTLLKKIKETTEKNYAVVAPTAVAAINAGGVTIHSFFQMPFGPIIPEENSSWQQKDVKYNDEKIKLLKCLELLIIDEISMVRADMLDFINQSLKIVKSSNLPFGGVQVLMIGDLYQLSPIAHDAWHVLRSYYLSPYFFDSKVLKSISMVTFELDKVYRQSDPLFIAILNQIREGSLSNDLLEKLNSRYDSSLDQTWKDEYITLTTHNNLVTQINQDCLENLSGELHTFQAKITGDFPKEAYPVDDLLKIKVGAQVMFIKNDSSGKKQYYNGKSAKIVAIANDRISVQFIDDDQYFEVEREEWQNLKYNLDQDETKIEQVNTGSFSQYPFKLAWAITIHKSQGLTFEKAIVDISSSFTHGQAYVALSRCKSLDGLLLKAPVKMENIITDRRIISFTADATSKKPNEIELKETRIKYEWDLIFELFDFENIKAIWESFADATFRGTVESIAFENLLKFANDIILKDIYKVGARFNNQETTRQDQNLALSDDSIFLERIKKASAYFIPKLEKIIPEIVKFSALKIYHDEQSEKTLNSLMICLNALNIKLALFNYDWNNFSLQTYTKSYLAAGNQYSRGTKVAISSQIDTPKGILNEKLYRSLIDWRKEFAAAKNLPEHNVLSDAALINIAAKPPKSAEQLANIKGVGIGNAVDLGAPILKIVNSYLGANTLF